MVTSADHLMSVSDKGIDYLAKRNTVATMLPGTTVFLGQKNFAPVRKMIEKGVRVAIGTDYNPGSCTYNSQALMMQLAMSNGKLTLAEAFSGITKNASLSLLRPKQGVINEGA
jgi:imidazolonepropionase